MRVMYKRSRNVTMILGTHLLLAHRVQFMILEQMEISKQQGILFHIAGSFVNSCLLSVYISCGADAVYAEVFQKTRRKQAAVDDCQ